MKDKKVCAPNNGFCIADERVLIAGVFAAIVIIAIGVSYFTQVEKTAPGYNTDSLKLFLMSLDKFTIALTLLLGLVVLAIAVKAFQKTKSSKFLLIMLAFGLFALEWILKLIDRYYIPGQLLYGPIENLLEMGIIVFLALGFFRK